MFKDLINVIKPAFLVLLFLVSCEKSGMEDRTESLINTSFNHRILNDYFVTSIAFDGQGNAWIGTFKQGLIRYSPNETKVYDSSNSMISEEWVIMDIEIGSQGTVWFSAEGLVKFDGESFTLYNTENSPIPEDIVWDIEIDSRDYLWFSSCRFNSGGLVHYNGSEWTVFTPDNSPLPDHSIHGIAIDHYDNVWLAVADYVNNTFLARISSAGQWNLVTGEKLGFQPYYYGNIRINSKNEVCAAIDYSLSSMILNDRTQVFIYNGESTKQLKYDSIYNVRKISIDNQDNIWGITGLGYAVYNGEEWFTDNTSFRETGIFAIEQSPDNRIWIGTGQGIYINE